MKSKAHASHVAHDMPDYAPETIADACLVNAASVRECSPNVPTLLSPEDFSFAAFLIEPEPEA